MAQKVPFSDRSSFPPPPPAPPSAPTPPIGMFRNRNTSGFDPIAAKNTTTSMCPFVVIPIRRMLVPSLSCQ